MSRKNTILALFAGIILFLSFSANPPNARTGAPGEGLCSDCHTLGGGMQNGSISVTGIPASITPNTAYVLTVTDSNPNGLASLAGFQITILNSNNTIAGNITGPSAGSTVQTFNGREYWEHNPAQAFPPSNTVMWTATWTSPNTPPNTTITYYAAGNIANGNGSNTGDLIVTSTGSGMLVGGGSNLMVTITNSTDVLCFGENTGSATAMATGGVMPYVYNWSNGASGATINNLVAGTYTVTVTDNAAATATASITIEQPPPLNLNTPVINNVSCNGGGNGSIVASASGGVSPYFFNWSNGSTGATISNLTAGSYTVTVTDDNNCTETATYMVTQPAVITISLVNLDHESCAGAQDGSITIGVTGGVNPFFAEWSNGSIGFTISGLAPGGYSVTVTDNNDCTKTASYTINPGSAVAVNLVQIQHVSCFGGSNGAISVNATGGIPPYTYNWSNGMTGASITGLTAGNYTVTATDMTGCTGAGSYTINQPPAINITINQTSQNLCFGDATADLSASVAGGTPPYTAIWSNGISGMNNLNLPAGTYTITVTDANGCTASSSATVTQPPLLTVNVVTTDETSSGANDGTATANVSGGSPIYFYSWNTGATTPSISGLPPGMYCVTVTDANGCSVAGCGQVDEFGCTIDVQLGPDLVMCEGDTLIITPSVTGPSGTVTYFWSDGSSGSSLQVTEGGEYCVTATDQANCQDVDCMIITQIIYLSLDCPVQNESAPGANDGAINCEGLIGFITYMWSNGDTTASISGLPSGEYCVTVTDMNGCTATQCFNVQPPNCQMTVASAQTNVGCNGDSTGSISLTVTGATNPVTYSWSNGETTSSINNLPAGIYSVTVADAVGCVVNGSFEISEPLPLVITIDSIAPVSDQGGGLIDITVTGGTSPYTYLWTDPVGATFITEDLEDIGLEGNYKVVVTDAAGCATTMDSIFVDMDVAVSAIPGFKTLKVYPVPAHDVLFVDIEQSITEVLITGVDGRLYMRIINPSSNQLQIGELEAGWYILRISDGQYWYIARLVK